MDLDKLLNTEDRIISVKYDGEFPNSCSGELIITVNGEVVYQKKYCCHSTGSVWFDEDWGDHVESGELIWEDADNFDAEIAEEVRKVLSVIPVCCGGCV